MVTLVASCILPVILLVSSIPNTSTVLSFFVFIWQKEPSAYSVYYKVSLCINLRTYAPLVKEFQGLVNHFAGPKLIYLY